MDDKEIMVIFVNNIRYYAKVNKLTQADIARQLGSSTGLVSEWFNGKKLPRINYLQRLANIFGILPTDLLTPRDEHNSSYKIILREIKNLSIKELEALKGAIDLMLSMKKQEDI